MWARVRRECFTEVVRFELSLEEFESKEIGLVQSRNNSSRKEGDKEETGLLHYLGSTCFSSGQSFGIL